jgi:hypothetical protein
MTNKDEAKPNFDGPAQNPADSRKFAFDLNPNLAEWIDRESARIASLVTDLTDRIPRRNEVAPHPNLPIKAHIRPEDIIGEITASSMDAAGNMVARFYQHQGRMLGLADSAMSDAQKAAERIWSRRELSEFISRTTILELLLEYVGAVARGMPTDSLSAIIINIVVESVRQVSVRIPIEELFVNGEFSFATAVLSPLSRAQLDAALDIRARNAPAEQVTLLRDELYSQWAGKTVMRFELLAEPKRAEELAVERAADYMALLQFYTAPAMILPLASHIAPRGARSYRTQDCIVLAPAYFHRHKGVTEPTYKLIITNEQRTYMERTGLMILSRLALNPSCEYEEKLLNSLLIYGRACYQLDQNDKLLQIMTAIEMFALRSDSEPIQAALADRLAFAISHDPSTRQQVAQNLRDAYKERSGRSHHGRSITKTETIEQFLRNAWAFFLTAIQGVGRYRTQLEFLDYLDRTKYGHGGSS